VLTENSAFKKRAAMGKREEIREVISKKKTQGEEMIKPNANGVCIDVIFQPQ